MKYVESYWIEELPNGVFRLLINCTQRELYYHDYNDTEILIAGTEQEYDNGSQDCVLKLETYLPDVTGVTYLRSVAHNKDQLSFYYIPYEKEWVKTRSNRIIKRYEKI